MTTSETTQNDASDDLKNCCVSNKLRLDSNDSTGYLYTRCGVGPFIISNIFLSASLIALAEMEIGCYDEDDEIDTTCGTIYGFKPSSLIVLIATLSGVLSAFIMPFIGAFIDFTPHRHMVGVISSTMLVVIQAIQIYTVESTWFPMAILQAINGFIYQIVLLSSYSYLPEIGASVEEKTFNWYSSLYYIVTFAHEVLFLLVIAAIIILFDTSEIVTAQVSQGIDTVATGGYFVLSWYYFNKKEAKAKLPEGTNLVSAGFKQVFRTSRGIYQHYPKTVGWFFIGCIFTEAAVASFVAVSVTYVTEVFEFNSTQLSTIFLLVILSTIPGSYFAKWLANRYNAMIAFKIQILSFIIVNFVAFLLVNSPDMEIAAYVTGMFWGFWIGWYYPLEKLIYAVIIPKGQEAELAGFFMYCTIILSWLPPLVFALMNEADIGLHWGGVHLNIYLFIGLVCFQLMSPWEVCLEDAKTNKLRMVLKNDDSAA